jgi:hypothetical protein
MCLLPLILAAAVAASSTGNAAPRPAAKHKVATPKKPAEAAPSAEAAPDADAPAAVQPEPARAAPPPASPARPSFASMNELWQQRRDALTRGDEAGAAKLLEALLDAKRSTGWPDVFVFGDALALEADAALLYTRDAARGRTLAAAAVDLAPHRPALRVLLARAQLAAGEGALSAAATLWQAAATARTEPALARRCTGQVFLAMAAGLLGAVALFVLVLLAKHSRALLHDLQHLLPRGLWHWHVAALVGLVLLAPLCLRAGAASVAVLALVVLSPYLKRQERLAAVVSLLLLAAVAFGLPQATAHFGYAGSRAHDLYLAVRDAGASDAAARLQAQAEPSALDLWALGLRARWDGDAEASTLLLGKAVEKLGHAFAEGGSEVPAVLLDAPFVPGEAQAQATAHLWSFVGGRLAALPFAAGALLAALIVALVGIASARRKLARVCPRCGALVCLRCSKHEEQGEDCVICQSSADLAGEAASEHARKEIEAHRHYLARRRTWRLCTVFVAGSGQMLRGAAVAGLVLAGLFFAGTALLATALDLLPAPAAGLDLGLRLVLAVAAALVMAISYTVALVHGFKEAR